MAEQLRLVRAHDDRRQGGAGLLQQGRGLEDPGREPAHHDLHAPAGRRGADGGSDDPAKGRVRYRRQARLDRLCRRQRRRRLCRTHRQGTAAAVHVPPTDIPNIGRFAMVADPQGAVFSLFKPVSDMPPPPADPATPGTIGWHELMASNGEKAFAFYAELFGWTKDEALDMGCHGVATSCSPPATPAIGGMMTKPAQMPAPSWNYYFRVDAIGAALEPPEEGRRPGHQRTDGSAGRRLDRPRVSTRRAQCSRWSAAGREGRSSSSGPRASRLARVPRAAWGSRSGRA